MVSTGGRTADGTPHPHHRLAVGAEEHRAVDGGGGRDGDRRVALIAGAVGHAGGV